ncbi:LPXTG cell wall anchor domain-containing protein [Streptomyces somaliensis]|uniref:LPXTG cell wall anchor domain-containing protein n=1 Tax=Streptomyces somaliensis TaxID=78355 RepID=UPI0020CB9D4D|nr:LPXTG cell wall anchor domain-containing protein [Streptomyces somaliensis]MCP9945663.1 LPXTG cell wall anchor domain-containing protein [Streptomyces somaliensis]MCP9961157.1 LPXTG cell wall anchor domain-containing protein [Streptomyces somaliensis]MCP9973950.1 LPXTG cell wall anchor domain-containing protein [Streptomyces somaliensis]
MTGGGSSTGGVSTTGGASSTGGASTSGGSTGTPGGEDPASTGGGTVSTGGSSTTGGGTDPCTVTPDGVECADTNNPDTNNVGSQPVQQGEAKEELAETGAAETSFLLLGAATMIAGGIGFRLLPRLVGGRTAA